MDGWMGEQKDRWRMGGRMGEQKAGWIADEWVSPWMDRWMDRWTDGRMDGHMVIGTLLVVGYTTFVMKHGF